MPSSKLQYYVLICDKKKKNHFIEVMAAHGALGIQTVYGRGSAKAGAFREALGFEVEEKKAVLTGLLSTEKAAALTETLRKEYKFHHANTGFAFSVPVEKITF